VSFRTLQEFITACDAKGDVKRIAREVDWKYEVTEIACREAKREGPLLLFDKVRGSRFPLAVNVLAASRRVEWALGRTPRAVGAEIEDIFHALPPRQLSRLSGACAAARSRARVASGTGARRTVAGDLARRGSLALPILQLWPGDGGRFVTFPLVFTEDPLSTQAQPRHLPHAGVRRQDHRMHWQIGRAADSTTTARSSGADALPVAVAVGADPATLLSAVAPLPRASTSWRSPGSCAGSRRGSCARARRTSGCPPMPSS
jgi:4-hydroxy-3-polyprenylbenzoate decarboxylase